MNHDEFRQHLDEISDRLNSEEWWDEILALKKHFDHSIERREPSHERRFNCFMYALHLDDSDIHYQINATTDPPIFADGCFIRSLHRRRRLSEKKRNQVKDGDLLVYTVNEMPVHAGLAVGKRVISKWGSGLLLEHHIVDVAAKYGSLVVCYEPLSRETAEREFMAYAKAHKA